MQILQSRDISESFFGWKSWKAACSAENEIKIFLSLISNGCCVWSFFFYCLWLQMCVSVLLCFCASLNTLQQCSAQLLVLHWFFCIWSIWLNVFSFQFMAYMRICEYNPLEIILFKRCKHLKKLTFGHTERVLCLIFMELYMHH